ncbi:arsenate reductase/protein-tyrosine-phosphatase family protein [Tessaracoccus defluvii]|jgi:protein-tyrosine-phosphatase|uniref:Helix-turn-helix domain-containing protein n=1 Tax=Tessaracoccus defluvii TaxID=1285901 RepID=A0A7H0H522_9ACTN|nr:helix-turn-helix domain-containing protein [Tessaracoccus defluvii]QNP55638.1 helix-turn-helix domain-containing protein [Tessaracoccus defluvii]
MELAERARMFAALGDVTRLALLDELAHGDLTPRALADALGTPGNLLTHHLGILQDSGLVRKRRSDVDGRSSYVQLTQVARAVLPSRPMARPKRIAFVCTANSARSQLAEALWHRASDIPAVSAGTHPALQVHPGAVRAAGRLGLDLSHAVPRQAQGLLEDDDLIISVCDSAGREIEPAHLHWSIPDPVMSDTPAAFDAASTELAQRIDALHHSIQGEES